MRFTFRQLEVFAAIANLGSVSQAARSLHLSQPATSAALADLEHQLGQALFHRFGKRLQLSATGKLLLPKVMELLERAQEIEQLARGSDALLSTQLRAGASTTIGNYLLPQLLGRLAEAHPDCRVSLEVENTRRIIEELLRFGIDIGFIEGSCQHEDIEVIPWREDEMVVVCAPSHPLARRRRLTVELLQEQVWILREAGSGTREVFDRATDSRFEQVAHKMEIGHTEAIKRAVVSGLGISCLSRLTVADELDSGRLVVLPTPFFDLRRQLSILLHREKYRSELLQAFLRICTVEFSGG